MLPIEGSTVKYPPPWSIPRTMLMNCSTENLSLTLGLCRDVFSMMMAKLSV